MVAMNPSMVMNVGGQGPIDVAYPIPGPVPQYQPYMPVPPAPNQISSPVSQVPPVAAPVNDTSVPISNDTTASTGLAPPEPADTGHFWLDFLLSLLPPSYRPNAITIALIIMLISLLIHIVPAGFFHRLKESWLVFWPPWQDRSAPARFSSSTHISRTRSKDVAGVAEARVRSSSKESETSSKAKVEGQEGSRAVAEVRASGSDSEQAKEKEEEKETAKRKALVPAAHEARRTACKTSSTPKLSPETVVMSTKNVDSKPADSVTQSEKSRAIKNETPPENAKSPIVVDPIPSPDPDAEVIVSDSYDPLMAGDYRPLRSVFKKSTKKPRQSKNVHHNLFMTMRGHEPHLIPFPHGLHPPPHDPRHTLWWKNIPKESKHLMAPPPPPKVVVDDPEVEAGEDETKVGEVEVKVAEDGAKEVKVVVEDEKKVKPTESEVRAKMKEREKVKEAEKPSTASAVAKIEIPEDPNVPVDPQV